jgi:hypothetical protein
MKRCPTCNRSFTDDTLSFCIDDGAVLVRNDVSSSFEAQPTAILGEPPPTVRMPPQRPTDYVPRASHDAPTQPPPYGWANETPVWVPPTPTPVPFSRVAAKQQNLAIVSLIFGLAAITFGWICGGPVFALIAVVLGLIALMQIKKNPAQYGGKPIALAGLITGGLVLLINAAIIAIWIVMLIIGAASN